MEGELSLNTTQASLSWRAALKFVIYRIDLAGKRPRHRAPLSEDAVLVGWKDEGGDPVFVAVDEEHGAVEVEEAKQSAQLKMLEIHVTEPPDFVITGDFHFRGARTPHSRSPADGSIQTRLKF